MSEFPKYSQKSMQSQLNNQQEIMGDFEKMVLKYTEKSEYMRIVKKILEMETREGRLALPNIIMNYKGGVLDIVGPREGMAGLSIVIREKSREMKVYKETGLLKMVTSFNGERTCNTLDWHNWIPFLLHS